MKNSFSIYAEAGSNEIEGEIIINPSRFPLSYNDLLSEIKETLRHEIEHVAQYLNPNKKEQYEKYSTILFYKYLMLRHEIPAYVRGLHTRAKTEKISLKQAIENHFKIYRNHFQNVKEIDEVRNVWYSYAYDNGLLNSNKQYIKGNYAKL